MGLFQSKFYNKISNLFQSNEPKRILMLGLDAAGKTTILYQLKINEIVTTVPTIGFNLEEVKYKNLTMSIWDIGGQDKIRKLWRYYFNGSMAIIFVVDSSDHSRIEEAQEELHKLLKEDELYRIPVLIYANKQDSQFALTINQIAEKLCMHEFPNREWFIQPCCATNGDGLYEGLDWLSNTLLK
jgi:ADP-ribosylation factor protein 1